MLKVVLSGVDLPAGKRDLLDYAVREHAGPGRLYAIRLLPEREYPSLDAVANELLHVQPPRSDRDAREPHEESGAPPGGDAYVSVSDTKIGV